MHVVSRPRFVHAILSWLCRERCTYGSFHGRGGRRISGGRGNVQSSDLIFEDFQLEDIPRYKFRMLAILYALTLNLIKLSCVVALVQPYFYRKLITR